MERYGEWFKRVQESRNILVEGLCKMPGDNTDLAVLLHAVYAVLAVLKDGSRRCYPFLHHGNSHAPITIERN